MAILYVLTVTDPNRAGAFPPSVTASGWYAKLVEYTSSRLPQQGHGNLFTSALITDSLSMSDEKSFGSFFFENESSYNSWLEEYKLTDATLLADITTWKDAHGITHNNNVYSLVDLGSIDTPLVN